MKKIIFPIIALITLSCASPETSDKKTQLEEYKQLVKEYSMKIETLESEISVAEENPANAEDMTVVRVREIIPEELSSFFSSTGKVEAIHDAYISPEVNGQISKILVSQGDNVRKGDLLIKLNTDLIERNIEEVKTGLDLAVKLYEKQKQLWEKEIGSEIQFLEARNRMESQQARLATLETQLALSKITAPFDGIVDDIMVKQGELASPGTRLLRLVNLDDMKITARVSESFIGSILENDPVGISFPTYPGWVIERPISRIGTVIDPDTRTFEVEVLLKNSDGKLRPNMISSLRIQDYSDPDALLVPSIILKQDFSGTFLFKATGKSGHRIAEKIYVETGKSVNDVTKITGGIAEGDLVIVEGYNLVSNGERVKIVD